MKPIVMGYLDFYKHINILGLFFYIIKYQTKMNSNLTSVALLLQPIMDDSEETFAS